jgi:peptidoglycan/xylan/chitin deacetylase (PgdA/CDA1 family)
MIKHGLKRIITSSNALLRIVGLLAGDFPKVFVYHRFAPPGSVIPYRVSGDEFGWQLDQIIGKYKVMTLGECVRYFELQGKWPTKSVIITIDDGYRDFYEWGFPELVQRGLKATFFVTVNFVDGKIWLWPDRLQWAVDSTSETEVVVQLHGARRRYPLRDLGEKNAAMKEFVEYCKSIPHDRKELFIQTIERELRISRTETPPDEYQAVSWDDLLRMCNDGIEIGSHTMNHPILSRIEQAGIINEICLSKKILEKKLARQISTFCYPNSGPGDITEEVVETVLKAGYAGAVFGIDLAKWNPYKIPRMGVSHDRSDFLWKLYGGESR